MVLTPIIALTLSLPQVFNHVQFNANNSVKDETNSFKVMTYNVRLFDLYNWSKNKETRNKIFSLIKQEEPAIICFQEFYHRDKPGFFDTKDSLVKLLKANNIHESYTHHMKGKQHFGLATMTAFPIVDKGQILFGNDNNNQCIYTDVLVDEDTVRIYNVHLASIRFQKADYMAIGDKKGEKIYHKSKQTRKDQKIMNRLKSAFIKRSEQSKLVLAHIKACPHEVVLCGDFNDTPNSYCYQLFNEYLADAFKVSGKGTSGTYIGNFPSYRIDYLFHSTSIHSSDYTKHSEPYSDHHALSCWVNL